MREIKAFLFDLDGVIVDTAKYHYLAWKELADEMNFVFTEEHNERLKGVSRMTSLDILLEIGKQTKTQKEKEALATQKNTSYVEFISKMDKTEILPGVEAFLKETKTKGIKIGLGSASKNAPAILDKIGLTDYFETIVDGNRISEAKPNPEVFLTGAKDLGCNAEECVVFEDAESGVEAAKRAMMFAVGIGESTILKQADMVVKGIHELSVDGLLETINDKTK